MSRRQKDKNTIYNVEIKASNPEAFMEMMNTSEAQQSIKAVIERSKEVKEDHFPNRPTLRVSEVAQYYDVTERTVYLWIEHGHLKTERTPGGQIRITKESVNSCRLAPP